MPLSAAMLAGEMLRAVRNNLKMWKFENLKIIVLQVSKFRSFKLRHFQISTFSNFQII
jgi:hypothetical protein